MFRYALVALALIALGALLAGGAEAVGGVILLPFLILGKIFLILLFFGAIGGLFRRTYESGPPRPPWVRHRPSRRPPEPEKSDADRFDEWHRLAHAREEVAGWTEGID